MNALRWFFASAVLLLFSCSEDSGTRSIRLSPDSGRSPDHLAGKSPASFLNRSPLHIAIANVISPRASYRLYDGLFSYIAIRLGRPVERSQRSTYAEVNDLIRYGDADVGFVCSVAYLQGQRDFDMELLAAPVVKGKQTYHSYILVPSDSLADEAWDLRDKVFAFTDPLSNSGRLAPLYLLHQRNERPETFFSRVVYTYSHDNSTRAVANKLVDGAAVDSLVFDAMTEKDPSLRGKLKIIWKSPPYGIPPVVVNPRLDADLKQHLRAIFFEMRDTTEGRRILASLGIDRFAPIEDAAYDSIRLMLAEIGRQP